MASEDQNYASTKQRANDADIREYWALSGEVLDRVSGSALLVTVAGWYRTKRPIHYCHFLIDCASLSEL
jgi:hypothetical protein